MIILYLLFVTIIGVICWKIIYEALFKDDELEEPTIEDIMKTSKLGMDNWESEQTIKPWTDKLDEQFKKWEMKGK